MGGRRARSATSIASSPSTPALWGDLPYDKYVFINMITEAGGGLEHANSTVLMTSRWTMGTEQASSGWSTS